METARLLRLIDALEDALGERDAERALTTLAELEELDPEDPAWPKRRAEICRQRGDGASELAALLRTAELQVDAGQVVRAIASCHRILVLSPAHPATEQMMSLLYEMPSQSSGQAAAGGLQAAPNVNLSKLAPASPEAPIQEIVLTEVVADTRTVALADPEQQSGATEILLGGETAQDLELFLEDFEDDPALDAELLPKPHVAPDETQSQLLKGTLFRAIGPDGAHELARHGEIIDLPADVPVIRQGDDSDRLYLILEGAVVPFREHSNGRRGGIRMGILESGDFFGEIGLLTDQPRNATVCTLVETRLLAIDRPAVWQLLSKHAEALTLLLRTVRVRLIDQLVRTHPMFAPFGRAKGGALARQFRLLEVRDGTTVIQQGLKEQGIYVVLAGRLEVIETSVDGEKSLAMIGHGDLVGEYSELYDQPAQASVISRGKCWLLTLTHRRIAAITAKNPRLNDHFRRLAFDRSRSLREAKVALNSSGHKT